MGHFGKQLINFKLSLFFIFISIQEIQAQSWQFSNYKIGDVANLKYREFGLGEWHDYQPDAYFLRAMDTVNGYIFLAFSGKKDCYENSCDRKISIQIIKNNFMSGRLDTVWKSLEPPKFYSVFGKFIVSYEVDNPWLKESELAEMEVPEEKWRGIQFLVDRDRLIPLEKMSKSKLRHLRHEVLLLKGHKHHASEITEYFLHRHHRRKVDSNAIHHDYTEAELYLLKCLTELIYSNS